MPTEEVMSNISLVFPAVPGITYSKFGFNESSNRIKGKKLYWICQYVILYFNKGIFNYHFYGQNISNSKAQTSQPSLAKQKFSFNFIFS